MLHYGQAAGILFLPGDGQGQTQHVGGSRLAQDPGGLPQGGPGGADVVHQQEALSGDALRMDGLIGPQDVGPAGVGVLQAGLGRVVQNFAQGLLGLHVPLYAQAPGLSNSS